MNWFLLFIWLLIIILYPYVFPSPWITSFALYFPIHASIFFLSALVFIHRPLLTTKSSLRIQLLMLLIINSYLFPTLLLYLMKSLLSTFSFRLFLIILAFMTPFFIGSLSTLLKPREINRIPIVIIRVIPIHMLIANCFHGLSIIRINRFIGVG